VSADNLHKILEPYLAATAVLIVVLGIAMALLKRHGDRTRRDNSAAERGAERQDRPL
jgi:hypothetical protein